MKFLDITEKQKIMFNQAVDHPLQSFEWGEFREKTGVKVVRKADVTNNGYHDAVQCTIHRIPHTPWTIGYIPKSTLPTQAVLEELQVIGKENNSIFMQLEPKVEETTAIRTHLQNLGLRPSTHPLFTKYNFEFDLTKSEEELLATMHHKTRYNIRVAQKHAVAVEEENTDKAFVSYLALTNETTTRQKFYAHSDMYHTVQWQTLPHKVAKDTLSAHLLVAKYNHEIVTAWILFVFKDTLYYPYGASSTTHREVMASNLMMWEAIRFGKKLGLKKFDMWGALGPEPNRNDPWYGFHRFKMGYAPRHVTYVGSFDFVLQPSLYYMYAIADKIRWTVLRLRK